MAQPKNEGEEGLLDPWERKVPFLYGEVEESGPPLYTPKDFPGLGKDLPGAICLTIW